MSRYKTDKSERDSDKHSNGAYNRVSTWVVLSVPRRPSRSDYDAKNSSKTRDSPKDKSNTTIMLAIRR